MTNSAGMDDRLKLRTWLCSVVFLDIVGYSKQSVERQMNQKGRFNSYLATAIQDQAEADRIILDTGDGAALCFLGDPEAAMFCAIKIRTFMVHEEAAQGVAGMKCRIGINLGSVKLIKDINGNLNAVGDGINVAQRVMSFAGDNQILVSRSFYEVVSCLSDAYQQLFRYGGVRKDKHVREHTVYDLQPPGPPGTDVADPCPIDAAPPHAPEPAKPLKLDPAALARVEKFLAPILGPIAPHLVQTAVKRSTTPMELHRALTAYIPEKPQQEAFLRFCVAEFRDTTSFAPPATRPAAIPAAPVPPLPVRTSEPEKAPVTWEPALLDRLRTELAAYIGPMAKVLVNRVSAKARSTGELYDLLAAEIPSPKDRETFRRKVAMAKGGK
jgi:class 3 adenylate cyclase